MPHRQILRQAAMHGVENSLESYKQLLGIQTKIPRLVKGRIKMRNGIIKRLIQIRLEPEKYGHNKVQTILLDRLIASLRKAKEPLEVDDILRLTCNLKLDPKLFDSKQPKKKTT